MRLLVPSFALAFFVLAACGGDVDAPLPRRAVLEADIRTPHAGVPDRGRDLPVVAVRAGGVTCAGTLVAPDVVLTARRCVSADDDPTLCAPPVLRAAERVEVLSGEDLAHVETVARGIHVAAPRAAGCEADVALVLLDRDLPVPTASFRRHGAALGDRVRTVGFAFREEAAALGRTLRDHVPVTEVQGTWFVADEAPCVTTAGAVALDERTGEIVGILSHATGACDDPAARGVYVRTDAWLDLVDRVLVRSGEHQWVNEGEEPPEDRKPRRLPKSKKPVSDLGGGCEGGGECAAAVCVRDAGRRYCSRTCSEKDHCPSKWRCTALPASAPTPADVCVQG
jgi:hypothetical protein